MIVFFLDMIVVVSDIVSRPAGRLRRRALGLRAAIERPARVPERAV